MSDPTVTAFLTKQLCSNGGRLERSQLSDLLDLPEEQIEQILQDEPLKFPRSSHLVLARSPLRICPRYLFPNNPGGQEEDEEKCPNLHLCRNYLRGLCTQRHRCKFSHDVHSDHNRAALKANDLLGLNEGEIKVLLYQNDNQLLPEDCAKYMRDGCDNPEECKRLHVCRFFTRGECNRRFCRRSHNLLDSEIISDCSWLNPITVQNFQFLCELKHNERHQETGPHREARGAHGPGRGRRPRHGRGPASQNRQRQCTVTIQGPRFPFRALSRPAFQATGGQFIGIQELVVSDTHSTHSVQCDVNSIRPYSTNLQLLLNAYPTTAQIRPQSKPVSGEAGPSMVPTPMATSPTGVSLKPEARLGADDLSPNSSPASNITEIPSVKSSPTPDQKLVTELGKMGSSSEPGPADASLTSSSTSKTLSYSTRAMLYAAQVKQASESSGPLGPSTAGASKVSATPSPQLVTTSMEASLKAGTNTSNNIASLNPSAASKTTQDLSTKSSSIPDHRLATFSPLNNPPNVSQTPSTTSKTLSFTGEDLYTAAPRPVSSTGTAQLPSSSSAPSSAPSGPVMADTPQNKPYASVEPMSRPHVLIGISYEEFELKQKSSNSTTPQLQPTTGITSPAPKKVVAAVEKTPEICLSNIWKFCKLGGRCSDMHYYLPYRWQEFDGTDWVDLENMENIEKNFSDPGMDRYQSINYQTMRLGSRRVRRLTTPSSVTRPSEYVLTTEWVWYWKDEFGSWTKYGNLNTKKVSSSIQSSDLETVYLSSPTGTIPFSAGNQNYIINCQDMRQRNILYQTVKDVRRRPIFLDFEKVKMLKGSTKSTADAMMKLSNSPLKTVNYPSYWCLKALPEIGYQKIRVAENCVEFSNAVSMFKKTVTGHVVKNLWRVQNPTLWQIYQWQKDLMKKKNSGKDIDERQLFHGTDRANVDAICRDNFDWRICGTNGTVYGQGSYFARDASYSHNYSQPTTGGTRAMFVARVLVGDFAAGDPNMRLPPQKYGRTESYNSCVDRIRDPSIFVVFEKLQIYPEYILEYEEEKKSSCVIS